MLRGSSCLGELEGEDWAEFLAPIVSLTNLGSGKELAVSGCRAGDDIAGLVDERYPGVEFVGEGDGVEIGASEAVVAFGAGFSSDIAIGAVLRVEDPSGVVTFGIGVEDAREREAELDESADAANRLQNGSYDGIAVAIDRGSSSARNCGAAEATEGNRAAAFGDAGADGSGAEGVSEDIVELAGEKVSQVIATIKLSDKCDPWSGKLQFGGPDVLRITGLRSLFEYIFQCAGSGFAVAGPQNRGGRAEADIGHVGTDAGNGDGAGQHRAGDAVGDLRGVGNDLIHFSMVAAENDLSGLDSPPVMRERELEDQAGFDAGLIGIGAGAIAKADALIGGESGGALNGQNDGELRLNFQTAGVKLNARSEHGSALIKCAHGDAEAGGLEEAGK